MEVFSVKEVGKFSDQNPDAPYSEKAEGGYIRNRVINNDKCSVTIACFRDGETPGPAPAQPPRRHRDLLRGGGESAWASTRSATSSVAAPVRWCTSTPASPTTSTRRRGSDALVYRVQIGADRSVKRPA